MEDIRVKRSSELSLEEVIEKYPNVPPLLILKADVQRRGVYYTDRALNVMDEKNHQTRGLFIFGARDAKLDPMPDSLLLRDGTSIIVDPTPLEKEPYIVDYLDGRTVLTDHGQVMEEVTYWPRAEFYDKTTTSGIPMYHIASTRPQRINVFPYRRCHFWDNHNGCRYCDIETNYMQQKVEFDLPYKLDPKDIKETIEEALKEPGRYNMVLLTGGSNTGGKEPFDEEVEYYIAVLRAIGECFITPRFPTQLVASAFSEKQLAWLYEATGLMAYTADLEVLNEKLFNWICPGKAEWVGYQEWKRRLIRAVDVFGRGNVCTGIVGGVELAKPNGIATEEEALKTTLEEAENLASHGVSTVCTVWVPKPGSFFNDQENPSLEYYVRLIEGLHNLRVKYNLTIDFDDYRRCGNHPDTDLSRLL